MATKVQIKCYNITSFGDVFMCYYFLFLVTLFDNSFKYHFFYSENQTVILPQKIQDI